MSIQGFLFWELYISTGFVWFLKAMDDEKALASGPEEGPALMEEFWDSTVMKRTHRCCLHNLPGL